MRNLTPATESSRGRESRRLQGRQVSHGAVWSVGGLAPRTTVAESAQTSTTTTGISSRAIVRPPLTAVQSVRDDLENYQGRVALALGIDRVQRTLDFTSGQVPCRKTQSLKRGHSQAVDNSFWSTSTWNAIETVHSAYLLPESLLTYLTRE